MMAPSPSLRTNHGDGMVSSSSWMWSDSTHESVLVDGSRIVCDSIYIRVENIYVDVQLKINTVVITA